MIVSLVMMIRYVVWKMIVPIVLKLNLLLLELWQINAMLEKMKKLKMMMMKKMMMKV
jgi:hypothetical protein